MPSRIEAVGAVESPNKSGDFAVFIYTDTTTYDHTGDRMTEQEALDLAGEVADLVASGYSVTATIRWRTN